jgi:membrane protein DedA with SNARE-associated domain
MTFSLRTAGQGATLAAIAVLLAIALGAVAVPDLADATSPLGIWIHFALPLCIFLETTILVGFLVHGELVLLVSGVAAARGEASLLVLIGLAWAAAVAGDAFGLHLGRTLGRPFLERHGRRFGLGPAGLARIDGFVARHGRKALFLGRFTGLLRSAMAFVLGSAGMPVRRLLPTSALSALVWTTTFTVIGYALAESFESAGRTATRITSAVLVAALAAFAIHARRGTREGGRAARGQSAARGLRVSGMSPWWSSRDGRPRP